jgi:transcriptional regulator with XRE-family HTH domain
MKPYVKEKGRVYTECRDAAQELKVTPVTVWYWYEGYHLPTLYNLVRFADLYNVSVDFLLGRTAIKELASQLKLVRAA